MDKENVKTAIKELLDASKKRKFQQSFDLIINLKGLDMKKTDQQVEVFVPMHYGKGKKVKICAFVGPELKEDAEKSVDKSIFVDDLEKYVKDTKLLKKTANEYSFFIAQANIMPKVAQAFGKVLGTRGKMPNPKAGCVVPPKAQLKPLYDRLQKTAVLRAKSQPVIKVTVGAEAQNQDEVVDNVITVYNALIHKLPGEENNIKNVLLKLTMSKPVEVKR
ncbi:50S ribosomal protein L1 [Candidatus Woesearchaeota archaeon]|nr:50S ribosomal protein L1 [Candidatus Woesearchaeota archaeon]